MPKPLPFQAHIALQVYGATPDDWQRALKGAFEQLAQNIPQSNSSAPESPQRRR